MNVLSTTKSPLRARLTAGGLTMVAMLSIAACGGESSAETTTTTAASTDDTITMPGLVHPSEAEKAAFTAAVAAISPDLGAKPDRAYTQGRNICLDSFNDKKHGEKFTLSRQTQRLDGDETTARKVIAAARSSFCPGDEINAPL